MEYTTTRPDYASPIEKNGELLLAKDVLRDIAELQSQLAEAEKVIAVMSNHHTDSIDCDHCCVGCSVCTEGLDRCRDAFTEWAKQQAKENKR